MTEENNVVETQLRLRALDGETVMTSRRVSLEIDGQRDVMIALAEMCLAFLESLGGHVVDEDGSSVPLGPTKIDPFDLGDDPVAQ